MADFRITVDIGKLGEDLDDAKELLTTGVQQAIQLLAAQTHARIVENVQTKLRSTRSKYLDALKPVEQVDDNLWVITLGAEAMWIEDGKPAGSMVDDLLTHKSGKPAKTAADGSRYRSIPFDQGKAQSEVPLSRVALGEAVRSELARYSKSLGRKVGIKKIEVGPDGRPLLGLLHKIDVPSPKSKSGIPLLQGVRIYQNLFKNSKGKSAVKRSVVTFRTVSSKHKAQGKWVHPGMEGKKFFDDAAEWAQKELDNTIIPMLVRGLKQ